MADASPRFAQSVTRRIAGGSFWIILGTGAGRIMNLAAMVLAARMLGAEGFGAFSLVQSTLGLFGMFAGAALGATATRFIAATHRTDPDRTGRVIGLVSGSALASSLLFGVGIVALAPWIARTVLESPELTSATALGGFLVLLGVLRGVQDAILAGFEAFRRIAILRFIEGAAGLSLVPILVQQIGPAGGILGLGLGLMLALLPGALSTRRELQHHGIRPNWREAGREWRLLRDFSAPSLLADTVATPVLWYCALLLSRTPDGMAQFGIYNGAYQWHGPLVFVPMAIASVSLPILAQAWALDDGRTFRRLFLKVSSIGLLLAFFPALVAAMLSGQVIGLYGRDFSSGGSVMVLLMLAAPLHVAANIATSAIQSMEKSWSLPMFQGVWGAALIVVATFLIDVKGAQGLAVAFIMSYLLLAVLKFLYVCWASGSVHRASLLSVGNLAHQDG